MRRFGLLAVVFSAFLFVACGDDDSSFAPRDDESSSSIEEESSSSRVTLSGASAESNGSSSSSAKSSSSTDSKSSSSVTSSSSGTSAGSSSSVNSSNASSSSSSKKTCKEEDEGKTRRDNGVRLICSNGFWVEIESSSSVSSSSYFDMTDQFNPDVEYGEFTDPRDGQKYRTVSIYDGKYYTDSLVFFAENLNYGKMVPAGNVLGDSAKYCYDDDQWYCDNGWGGLYTWSAAMNIPSICDSVKLGSEQCAYTFRRDEDGKMIDGEVLHQGLCPEGWHIANDGEWAYLAEKSGGGSYVSYEMGSKVAGFGSKNRYGMSILPVGYWEHTPSGMEHFTNIKMQTFFWLPEQDLKDAEKAKHVNIMSSDMTRGSSRSKYKYAHSIRCVKNY